MLLEGFSIFPSLKMGLGAIIVFGNGSGGAQKCGFAMFLGLC